MMRGLSCKVCVPFLMIVRALPTTVHSVARQWQNNNTSYALANKLYNECLEKMSAFIWNIFLPTNLSGKTSQIGGARRERASGLWIRAADQAKTKTCSLTSSRMLAAKSIISFTVATPSSAKQSSCYNYQPGWRTANLWCSVSTGKNLLSTFEYSS